MQPRSKPERAAPAASPPSAARLPALAELPAALRQQVPALAIGGSVYSAQPSARLLIVNGQVLHEGASLAPRLTIEHIRPKSAVFSIDGTHFELPM
jgi:general secretion pathway protein B